MSEPAPQVSEEFFEAFRSGCGSLRDTCQCGREHWDAYNLYDWEKGEKEELETRSKANPDKCIAHDGSFSSYEINGLHFIMDCPCGGGWKYEQFIRRHAAEIAEYLNTIAAQMIAEAQAMKVTEAVKSPADPGNALLREVMEHIQASRVIFPPDIQKRILALLVTQRIMQPESVNESPWMDPLGLKKSS